MGVVVSGQPGTNPGSYFVTVNATCAGISKPLTLVMAGD